MNKEIRNYQESMFMGLNLRQCIFSLLAILVAVGIYFGLGDYVGQEMTGWLCILGAAPFAACGFFQYHGMNAEQFAWAYLKSEFLYPKRLLFQSEDLYHACMEETLALGEKTQGDGTALMKKREQRAKKKRMKQKKKSGRSGAFDLNLTAGIENGPGEIQSAKVCPTGNPRPTDLAGWGIPVRDKVFQVLSVFGYQLCHRKQRR